MIGEVTCPGLVLGKVSNKESEKSRTVLTIWDSCSYETVRYIMHISINCSN